MARALAVLTLLWTLGICLWVRADQLADLQRAREDLQTQENRARQQRYAMALRLRAPLPQHQMSQIMHLAVEQGRLTLHTTLQPVPYVEQRRADIEGLSGPALVVYGEFLPGRPDVSQFDFTLEEYPDPLTFGRVHLLWRPNPSGGGELQIESSRQKTRENYARVIFQQSPGQVILIAYRADNASNRDAENVNLSEKDFATLRQKHAAALEKWLRPVFHRLQQDSVFAADSNAAWQALVDDWPVDPAVGRQIERLVPDLNAPDWASRHRAANEIAGLGRSGATAIVHMSRDRMSLEQNVRLDQVLSRFRPLPAEEVKPLRNDPNFLLDCEYSDDPTVRRLAAARLTQILGHRLELNLDAPESMRAEAIERIRTDLTSPTQDR